MSYTTNEVKVYENACQSIELSSRLELLQKKENELIDLIDLFLDGGNHRKSILIVRRDDIIDSFAPKITDAKKQLKNCERRLKYNSIRC